MPIPKPKKNEEKDKFIDRCMSNDTMNEEYPDSKQRYAVCMSQWENKDKEEKFMSDKKEIRSFNLSELRSESEEGGKVVLRGYASVFNQETRIGGLFIEKVKPGAFTSTIATDDVRALINHNPQYVIGRNTNGTLRMTEDVHGLKIEIDPPNTSFANDLLVSVDRGDISQMSFSFEVLEGGEEWQKGKDGQPDVRTLVKVRLWDVSPVTYPAYENTAINVAKRSYEEWQKTQEEPKSTEEKENSEVKRDAEGKPTSTLKIHSLKLGLKSKL